MSLQAYGLLKCKAIATRKERDNNRPHYHIHAKAYEEDYRISINIKSNDVLSELLFYTNENIRTDIIKKIVKLPYGFYFSNDCAVDYVRSDLGFDRDNMRRIPHSKAGPNNDLNEKLDYYIDRAVKDNADMYVYGTRWENGKLL